MFCNSFRRGKKAGCILLAVLILFLTPACDYLDARHVKKVEAASVAIGVTAVSLLKVTAAAFGVVIATAAASKAADAFDRWLHQEGRAESVALWNQAQANAQAVTLDESFVGDVRRWLEDRFSTLDSGEVSTATVGTGGVITNGVPVASPEVLAAWYSSNYYPFYASNKYAFMFWLNDVSSNGRYLVRASYALDSSTSGLDYYCIFTGSTSCFYTLNDNGTLSSCDSGNREYFYDDNLTLVFSRNLYSSDRPAFDSDKAVFVNNAAVIVTDLSSLPGSGALLSNVLAHATATYGLDASVPLGISFGSFSDSNLAKLCTLQLTSAGISKIQQAVDQAVSDNTSTGEDGTLVYTPDISQAIIDAYNQGLTDAGTVVDPIDPDDPDIPVVPDTGGILDFLAGLKDSLKTWITSIPDAVSSAADAVTDALASGWTTLWGHLTGIGDSLAGILTGVTDIPDVIGGLFTDLHGWILDIPDTFEGLFTDLHDWILDVPAAVVPGADEITVPIVDTIKDTFTVDADAVQEAVEAEQADLWNLPFFSQAEDLFDGFQFSDQVSYPKIQMDTPDVLRPYYDHPKIVLLDFEDYKDHFSWARLMFRAAIWLAFVWHVVDLVTPKLRIS